MKITSSDTFKSKSYSLGFARLFAKFGNYKNISIGSYELKLTSSCKTDQYFILDILDAYVIEGFFGIESS